jgi:hypothetical protein
MRREVLQAASPRRRTGDINKSAEIWNRSRSLRTMDMLSSRLPVNTSLVRAKRSLAVRCHTVASYFPSARFASARLSKVGVSAEYHLDLAPPKDGKCTTSADLQQWIQALSAGRASQKRGNRAAAATTHLRQRRNQDDGIAAVINLASEYGCHTFIQVIAGLNKI